MRTADTVITEIIDREGREFTNTPGDRGGPTRFGITLATLSEWRGRPCTADDVKSLAESEAREIYLSRFYLRPGFYKVSLQSAPVAVELMDTGVNCGPAVPAIMLQRCLNAFNNGGKAYADVKVDGGIGPATLTALSSFLSQRGRDGERVLLNALNCLQGERYIELAEKDVSQEKFAYGWIAARVGLT